MRLSTYFADEGEVFIFNLAHEFIQEMLLGDYVIVYVESAAGPNLPKDIIPTTDRIVRIVPFGEEVQDGASKSFIRFNNHFRNIRELVLYPTRKSDNISLDNLKSTGQNGAPPENLFIDEAGVRMATGERSCRVFTDYDVDPSPRANDSRMKHLFTKTENIRQRGSVISFGMAVDNPKKTGYEFCQVELAADDGERVLFVAIKVPDVKKVQSAYLKKQPQNDDMHELANQNFAGVDQGHFIIKKYGKLEDYPSGNFAPMGHEFYNLDGGEQRSKQIFQGYSRQVGRVFIEPPYFNIGLFEEWRQMIPPQTIDQHLKIIHDLYTEEIRLATANLEMPRGRSHSIRTIADSMMSNRFMTDRSDRLRRQLHILRDAQMYVALRRKDIEHQRVREYNFSVKTGPHPKEGSRGRDRRPRTPEPSTSGSTTPTNSPRRKAEMARLTVANKELTSENKELANENKELTSENKELANENKDLKNLLQAVAADPRYNGSIIPAKADAPGKSLEEVEDLVQALLNSVAGQFEAVGADAEGKTNVEADVDGKADATASATAGASVDTGAATATDAGANAGSNAGATMDAGAGAGAAMDTGADVAMNGGTDASTDAGAGDPMDASPDDIVTDDDGANADSDSSDEDDEGGVRLTPAPANIVQESLLSAIPSKSPTLDGQYDTEPSTSSGDSLSIKRSQGEISRVLPSLKDNSSGNDGGNIESGGGTPDQMPSPKKRKLSPSEDDSSKAGRSSITKLM